MESSIPQTDLGGEKQPSENRSRTSAWVLWAIIGATVALHIVFLTLNWTVLAGVTWKHEPFHACVEFCGTLIALLVAGILLAMQARGDGTTFNVWIAGALIGMGILDGLHAMVHVGIAFVWLHSTATLMGGALFALVWCPRTWADRIAGWWHYIVFTVTLTFGLLSMSETDWLPAMVVNGEFTAWSKSLNFIGGALFAAAAVRLLVSYQRTRNLDDLLFCLHCVLFGGAAIMFEQSTLWDVAWWGWHILRLLAYSVALWFVVAAERSTQQALQQTTDELQQLNATLEDRVQSRTEAIAVQTRELAREQYLLDSLVEGLPNPIFFKDADGRFIRVNRGMANDAGFEHPADLVGLTDAQIWAGENFFDETHTDESKVMATGDAIIDKEEQIVDRNGNTRYVIVTKMPLKNEAGEIVGTFGIASDITSRKRDEQQLATLNDDLIQSNRDLEQFAYVASHDLNEPLRAVAGFTQLLYDEYADQLDDTARTYITHAVDGAKRMQVLISSLLEFSRIQSRGNPLIPTDVNRALDEAITNLQSAIDESHATINRDELPTVAADHNQLVRVFQNLVSNALKFRSVDTTPTIEITASHDRGTWTLCVRDNGIGIAAEHHDHVFDIFKRLHPRSKYPGTGIGLALCHRIVVRHGGRMWVEAEPGTGSAFYFTLSERSRSESRG